MNGSHKARIVTPEPQAHSVKVLKWPKMSARYGGIMRPGTDVALIVVSIEVDSNHRYDLKSTYLIIEIRYKARAGEKPWFTAIVEM